MKALQTVIGDQIEALCEANESQVLYTGLSCSAEYVNLSSDMGLLSDI